jgi:outer membrane protein OmpA-like peptidoglycan-associated protein
LWYAILLLMLVIGMQSSIGHAAQPGCLGELATTAIVDCLKPAPLTRSLGAPSRGISIEGTAQRPQTTAASVELQINFEINSEHLTSDAVITLENLAKALSNEQLAGSRFLIAGHTDASGSDGYNLVLSERRAAIVKSFLVERFHIGAARLESRGYGRTRLLDPENPRSALNRRVEISNIGAAVAAAPASP